LCALSRGDPIESPPIRADSSFKRALNGGIAACSLCLPIPARRINHNETALSSPPLLSAASLRSLRTLCDSPRRRGASGDLSRGGASPARLSNAARMPEQLRSRAAPLQGGALTLLSLSLSLSFSLSRFLSRSLAPFAKRGFDLFCSRFSFLSLFGAGSALQTYHASFPGLHLHSESHQRPSLSPRRRVDESKSD